MAVNRWNMLDQRTVDAHSLYAFKNSLSRMRETIRWASSYTRSANPIGLAGGGPAGRPHEVNHKVNKFIYLMS